MKLSKILTTIALLLSLSQISTLRAQMNYNWAKRFGDTGGNNQIGKSIVSDKNGNVYLTGLLQGTVDFDPGNGVANLTAAGSNDNIFFAKYNSNGNFIWAKRIGDTNSSKGLNIQVDDTGNVYLLANFEVSTSLDFDPGAGVSLVNGQGNKTIAFAKYNSQGNLIWARSVSGSGDCYATAIELSSQGKIHIGGYFYGTADFDPSAGTSNLISAGTANGFVAQYDNQSTLQFVKQLSGSNNEVTKIALDYNNDVIATGFYRTNCDFDPLGLGFNRTNDGNADFFVCSFSEIGTFNWAITLDGIADDIGNAIATDSYGNIYVAGNFLDSLDTDPTPVDNFLVPGNPGTSDNFIAKYDENGLFLWSFKFGNNQTDNCYSLDVSEFGSIFVCGSFTGIVDFDPGTSTFDLDAGGSRNIYLAHYDFDGNYSFAYGIGSTQTDEAFSVYFDAAANLYLTGYFRGTVDFDVSITDTASLTSASGGNGDIFMAKYSQNPPLEITKPFANSTWLVDANYPISWNSSGIDTIKIERLELGQTTWELLANVVDSPSVYSYFLPSSNPLNTYTIRVSDKQNPTVKSEVDVRVKFSPQLNYPLGGEIFKGDSLISVNWFSSITDSAFFDLKFSVNGGANWFTMRDSVQTFYDSDSNFYIGNYNWRTPVSINSTNCKVGIFEVNQATPLFSSAAFTIQPPSPTSFEILSPNGSEVLEKRKRYFITWTGVSMPPFVVLSYTVNGTFYNTIDTIPNLGYYEWRIADSISTTCRIKVSNLVGSALDSSDNFFEIGTQAIDEAELLAPLLGDIWCAGTQQYIRWTSNISGKIKLMYKPASGSDVLIDSVNAADGMYFWTVPNNPSIQNRIRIEPNNSGTNLSTSDNFSICPNTSNIIVINPNGGESYFPGAYKLLTFVKNGIDLVNLEYSIDGGNNWIPIEDSVSTNTFYWEVPNTPSANCYLRVYATDLSSNSDTNNLPFTILAPFTGISALISNPVTTAIVCKNSNFWLPFTVSAGVFDTSNVFTAQLSDSLGNFSGNITPIGFVKDTTSDSIWCSIPPQIANGILYKIRIVADMPPASSASSASITLDAPEFIFKDTVNYYYLPNARASFPNLVPPAGGSILWNFGDGATSPSVSPFHNYSQSGIFDVSVKLTNTNGCSTTKTNRGYNRVDKKFPNRILNPNNNSLITGVSFKNDSTGSIAFSDGSVKFTNDNGTNWYAVQPTGLADVKAIKIKNALEWIVVGNYGGVRKTLNRGLSWDTVTFANGITPSISLNAIDFASPTSGYIAGDSGRVFRFVNGKFNLAPQFTTVNLHTVFDDGNNAFVAGDSGKIVKRSSGIWVHKQSGLTSAIRSLIFAPKNSNLGYAVGDNGKIIQSADAGETWSISLSGVDIDFASIACSEYGDSAWAVGSSGIIYQTMDQGQTWERYSKGATTSNTRVAYKIPKGYITGSSGSLRIFNPINSNPSDSSLVVFGKKYRKKDLIIYPNPAQKEFTLALYSEFRENLRIVIKDIQGKELKVIVQENVQGTFTRQIELPELPKGIYFVHVINSDDYRIKKLILLD
jgi:photosystem II stability/assembly factor-like uncharacterized protein